MKYKTIVQWGEENYHIEKEQKTLHKNHFRNKFPTMYFLSFADLHSYSLQWDAGGKWSYLQRGQEVLRDDELKINSAVMRGNVD